MTSDGLARFSLAPRRPALNGSTHWLALALQPLPCARRFVPMSIIRSGSQAPVKGPAEYFTGNVTIE